QSGSSRHDERARLGRFRMTLASRATSPKCQLHTGNKGPRRTSINRASAGRRENARGVLQPGNRTDRVRYIVGRRHVGLVEYVLDLDEEDRALEVIAHDLGVIVNIEIDEAVARRLQQVGVLHEERIEPDIFGEATDAFPLSKRLVVSEPAKERVRCYAGNLVSAPVEGSCERACAELLGVVHVELVEQSIGGNQSPAWIWPPFHPGFHARVHRGPGGN